MGTNYGPPHAAVPLRRPAESPICAARLEANPSEVRLDPEVTRPAAIVYIDGFNLYRRCLEQHPDVKWLDPFALAARLLPGYRVTAVHYFTALVKPSASPDLRAPQRQQVYLRALKTLPNVSVHLGKFRVDPRRMVAQPTSIDPTTGLYRTVLVRKIEEKGSDVNLAVRMMADVHAERADLYVVLTNDSDQAGTLRVIKDELHRATGLISPMATVRASKELIQTRPDVVATIRHDDLLACQLPDSITDQHGTITRPPQWAK